MKKKMLMIVNYESHDKSIGVTLKIDGLIQAFKKKGIEVFYTSYDDDGIGIYNNDNSLIYKKKYSSKTNQGLTRRFDLLRTSQRFISTTKLCFDLVFTRWIGFDLPFIRLLKLIKKKQKSFIIIDMHSYFPGIVFPSIKGKYMTINTNLFKRKAMKYLDTVLTEGDVSSLFGKKTIRAAIGVDLNRLQEHHYLGNVNELNIISVANERPYHGYDRLIRSIAENDQSGEIKVRLHLVGELYDSSLELIKSTGLQNSVILYGKQTGRALDQIFDKCNVAAGPLCPYRVGGKKDPGLKTKEYFGRGIPYFFAGEDFSVPSDYPFVFRVSDSNDTIDFGAIYQFYQSVRDRNDVSKSMREYATLNYSWDAITDSFLQEYKQNTKDSI